MSLRALDKNFPSRANLNPLFIGAMSSILVLVLALSFRQIDSPDIGLHLAPGKWILSHRAFPEKDVFTFGAANHEDVDLYWLYQVSFALLEKLGGSLLLVLSNGFLIACSLFIMLYRGIRDPHSPIFLSLVLLFFIAITANYEMRPHVVSWIYVGLLALTWERFEDDRNASLIAVPLIMLLWVNTQPTFVLGWIITFCFWLGICLNEKRINGKATIFAALSFITCLANPYFVRGLQLPFVQFGFLQQSNVFKTAIAEYAPLAFLPNQNDYIYFGHLALFRPIFVLQLLRIALALLFLVQIMRRRIRIHEAILFLLLFYLNSLAEKNIGYFILATTPIIVRSFGRVTRIALQQEDGRRVHPSHSLFITKMKSSTTLSGGGGVFVIIIISLVTTMRVVTNDYYSSQHLSHRFGYKYNNLFEPVGAVDFLKEKNLTARILNHINFGGYFIDHLSQPVYIDGRNEVMGEELANEYLGSNTPGGLRELSEKYNAHIMAFPHKDGAAWLDYARMDTTHWRLVYFDELAAIYLRNDYALSVPRVNPDSVLASLGSISSSAMDAVLQRSFRKGFFDPLFRDQYFPVKESEKSVFCSDNGWPHLAIRLAMEGIRRSSVDCPELFYNLAMYFDDVGDRSRAAFCRARAN
jgi:hypothetical protein